MLRIGERFDTEDAPEVLFYLPTGRFCAGVEFSSCANPRRAKGIRDITILIFIPISPLRLQQISTGFSDRGHSLINEHRCFRSQENAVGLKENQELVEGRYHFLLTGFFSEWSWTICSTEEGRGINEGFLELVEKFRNHLGPPLVESNLPLRPNGLFTFDPFLLLELSRSKPCYEAGNNGRENDTHIKGPSHLCAPFLSLGCPDARRRSSRLVSPPNVQLAEATCRALGEGCETAPCRPPALLFLLFLDSPAATVLAFGAAAQGGRPFTKFFIGRRVS